MLSTSKGAFASRSVTKKVKAPRLVPLVYSYQLLPTLAHDLCFAVSKKQFSSTGVLTGNSQQLNLIPIHIH